MAEMRHREETINTVLAQVLSRYGVGAEPETIHRHGLSRPDVLFLLGGLRVDLEGKFADVTDAESVVLADAEGRVTTGLSHIAVAAIYPPRLRTTPLKQLPEVLDGTALRFTILSEAGREDWNSGTPREILEALRRVQQTLSRDDVVAQAARDLSDRIESIAALWSGQPATCDRLSDVLGMPVPKEETVADGDRRRVTATKVAALVLANALIFQEQLAAAGTDRRVRPLRSLRDMPDVVGALQNHWHMIWSDIDYIPIFRLAEDIMAELPSGAPTMTAVRWLVDEAVSLCNNQTALRHDLMGRIYHWLLYHAKYLGTYYTGVAAATLLLKLTLDLPWSNVDFGSVEDLKHFGIVDLACGTGTLLMAADQAVTDQFVRTRVEREECISSKDLALLHQTLMEDSLHGYDVLPSAIHLTAATLGMLAPRVAYEHMNLWVVPLGVQGQEVRLGSLDFLASPSGAVTTQMHFGTEDMKVIRVSPTAHYEAAARVPETLRLCVMNPPFVRSVGGNLLFGGLPEADRRVLQTRLKRDVKAHAASITAGLGSVFVAVADRYMKPGGRLAFILPIALATGEAWGVTRRLIADKYHLETVIVSHDAARPNFSENTDLSELMFIARKRAADELPGPTVYVNLWVNPQTIYEALEAASQIQGISPAEVDGVDTASARRGDNRKIAEVVRLPAPQDAEIWTGVQFAQTAVIRAAAQLGQGRLAVPGQAPGTVPLCPLAKLGALGPDRKRVHEGFAVSSDTWTPYAGFWNHEAKTVTTIHQRPNAYLVPWAESPRGPDYGPRRLWPRAGRILLVERVRTTTQRMLAISVETPVLANTWWPLKASLSVQAEKALLLWLNSTPALVLVLARRVTTEGAWMQMKQPAWASMPVLNVAALSAERLAELATAYDRLADRELKALAHLHEDPVRAAIDAALSAALGLPDIGPLRELLAREPGLTGVGLSPKLKQGVLVEEEPPSGPIQLRFL